jgi:quinoprotein glucose dehydrogenase
MAKTLARAAGAASLAVIAAVVFGAAAQAGPKDWTTAGQDLGGQRYSRAVQITPENVGQLKEAWVYHMQTDAAKAAAAAGAAAREPARNAGGAMRGLRTSESIPLVVGDTMYLGSPYGRILALDATTGKEKWVFELPDTDTPSIRGISYWKGGAGAPASIVFGGRLGRLYSLNAKTGKLNPKFGVNGVVNLKTPEMMPWPDVSLILPTQPIIYKNLIITGTGPGEGPGGANARKGSRGDTRAWDAATGKLVWTFHTVPRPGEFGYDTWGGDSAKDRSGVNVWGHMTVDEKRGIVYMPLGAPNNDRMGIDRPGNNLFSSSIVAADANTGKYLWHFQVVHHDIWDWDTQAPPVLFDIVKDGKTIPALATVNKNALLFFLNRVTGEPIYPVEERPVPASDVPGEQTSPTQPFPVVTPPLSQNSVRRSNLYKGVQSHQEYCERLVDDNDFYLSPVPYTPPKLNRYTVNFPGTQGGVNFYGPALDPQRGILVTNVNNLAQPMRMVKNADGTYSNSGPLAGTRRFWDPEKRLPCGPTPWGELVGVDVNTGKIAWQTTLGVTDDFPEGQKDTGRPGLGGAITTASGLTFVGATDDARFRAFETATGKKVWETKLPASGYATPITYEVRGKQYVAIVATGGSQVGAPLLSDGLHVFALPN